VIAQSGVNHRLVIPAASVVRLLRKPFEHDVIEPDGDARLSDGVLAQDGSAFTFRKIVLFSH
jgi:hypothetical protein